MVLFKKKNQDMVASDNTDIFPLMLSQVYKYHGKHLPNTIISDHISLRQTICPFSDAKWATERTDSMPSLLVHEAFLGRFGLNPAQ